jgi:uncharacterized membrane protein (DUF485 family)
MIGSTAVSGWSPAPHSREPAPDRPQREVPKPGFVDIQASSEFAVLRRRRRLFIFPVSLLFFSWYMLYVLLAAYSHDFMSYRLTGQITVGLVFGLLQFVSTAAITLMYNWYAKRRIDPQVRAVCIFAGVDQE